MSVPTASLSVHALVHLQYLNPKTLHAALNNVLKVAMHCATPQRCPLAASISEVICNLQPVICEPGCPALAYTYVPVQNLSRDNIRVGEVRKCAVLCSLYLRELSRSVSGI